MSGCYIFMLFDAAGSCGGDGMERSDKTARELYEAVKANPTRKRFGFGRRPALINIDLQNSYTSVGEFGTAYETDPKQLDYVNALADAFRAKNCPVERIGERVDVVELL